MTEAKDEAAWCQQLYNRGKYAPWHQDHSDQAHVDEHLTVGDAVERYVQKNREAGERGEG